LLVPVVLVLFLLTLVVYCSILLSTVVGAAWVLACFMYIKAKWCSCKLYKVVSQVVCSAQVTGMWY